MNTLDQLQAAIKSVNYCKDALKNDLENWERNEFQTVLNESKSDVIRLKSHINANFEVFGVTV